MQLLKSPWFAAVAAAVAWCCTAAAADNGKQTDVTWDNYSLTVNDERLFVFSGEFHYNRLPVPELWLDVFQKLRANGFNTISGISCLSLNTYMLTISAISECKRMLTPAITY